MTFKEYWKQNVIGDYDFKFLCMPYNPFSPKGQPPPPFFARDEKLSWLVAIVMGLQHALAMYVPRSKPSKRGGNDVLGD